MQRQILDVKVVLFVDEGYKLEHSSGQRWDWRLECSHILVLKGQVNGHTTRKGLQLKMNKR